PELSRAFRVASDGSITLPFLGRVAAQQKTPDELSSLIADRLRGDYLQDPQVSIAVLQINSRTYFIQGAVRRPGLYQVEGQPSLLKLITIAGGLSENYGSTAFIIREINKAGAGQESSADDGGGHMADNAQSKESKESNAPAHPAVIPASQASTPDVASAAKYE